MKKILLSLILSLSISFSFASTIVKGGIYANATWTKANSPYIIMDSVVVFPGVVLTIQPGVTVEFANNQNLEIRQAQLIANGTATDSITFTSNSSTPTPGIYAGIFLNGGSTNSQFRYCNFMYSKNGVRNLATGYGFMIKNCKIFYNVNGIYGGGLGNNSVLDSCILEYNTDIATGDFDTIKNCTISKNSTGVEDGFTIINSVLDSNSQLAIYENTGNILNCRIMYNAMGIFSGNPLVVSNCAISHNKIGMEPSSHTIVSYCLIDSNATGIENGPANNPSYNSFNNCQISYDSVGINDYGSNGHGSNMFNHNIVENNLFGIVLQTNVDSFYCNGFCSNTNYALKYTSNANTNCVKHNYWCEPDSVSTEIAIYDGYDNINYGLVFFMPIDSTCSPSVHAVLTSINEINNLSSVTIYPNPTTGQLFINLGTKFDGTATLTNVLGQDVYTTKISGNGGSIQTLNVGNLTSGVYFLKLESNGQVITKKVMKL